MRVLLADDSPHAQRIGERVLREEGWEVVTVSDGETALLRLQAFAPDLVLADVTMPGLSGYDLCRHLKDAYPKARVVLTAGAVEPFDEAALRDCRADATLKKPFEASALLREASLAQPNGQPGTKSGSAASASAVSPPRAGRAVVVLDPEQVRAAVTVALDQILPSLTDHITEKVLLSLNLKPYAR